MRPGHPIPDGTACVADLASLSWVLPDVGGAFKRQIGAIFLMGGVPVPSSVVRCDSLAATEEIVRVSDRVAILPLRVVAPELACGSLRTVALRSVPPPRAVGVRIPCNRARLPLPDLLVEAMQGGSTLAVMPVP